MTEEESLEAGTTSGLVRTKSGLSRQRSVKFSKSTDDVTTGYGRDRRACAVDEETPSASTKRRFKVAKVRVLTIRYR